MTLMYGNLSYEHLFSAKVVALTGGIGAGKTFVLRCFQKLGYHTINTDQITNSLLTNDMTVLSAIHAHWPSAICNNKVNKELLGVIIFSDESQRLILQEIMHPAIKQLRNRIIQKYIKRNTIIVVEIPLLFEVDMHTLDSYKSVISLICPESERKKRALNRNPKLNDRIFNRILEAQVEDDIRMLHSDHLIYSLSSYSNVYRQVKNVATAIKNGA